MNPKAQKAIEEYLKKQGFTKVTGKDVFVAGMVPNMKVVNLEKSPPEIGIRGSAQQWIEAENSGIAAIQDIKAEVLSLYNQEVKKPAEQEKSSSSDTPPPKEEPPKKPDSAGESHPFICYACQAGISVEQRNASFKEHKKALCEKCIAAKTAPILREPPGNPEAEMASMKRANEEEPKPEPVKEPKKEKEKKKMVKDEPKTNVPAVQEKAQTPAISDSELDAKIEKAKTRRYLAGQGGSYKVSGKERPDSAAIQNVANDVGVSTEILVAEQTDKYAHVIVRAHLGNHFVDAAVHHDYAVEFQLKTMEIIEKNPDILDHYEGLKPVIKESAKIKQGDYFVDAKYYLVHALLSFQKFSLRDAVTKAMSAAQAKMLNQDSRDEEEVKSEQAERDLVEKNKRR